MSGLGRSAVRVSSKADAYRRRYVDLDFEPAELFRAIEENFGCHQGPVSRKFDSYHSILFFPHVVYVDHSPVAKSYFADAGRLLRHFNAHKSKSSPATYTSFLRTS